MTDDLIREASEQLFRRWTNGMVASHCIPVMVLAMGVDAKAGHLTVCTDSSATLEAIQGFLADALESVNGRIVQIITVGEGKGEPSAN